MSKVNYKIKDFKYGTATNDWEKEHPPQAESWEEFPGWAPDLDKECPKWLEEGTICSHPDGLLCDHRAIVINGEAKIQISKAEQKARSAMAQEILQYFEDEKYSGDRFLQTLERIHDKLLDQLTSIPSQPDPDSKEGDERS